ncbi:diacylglycerol kinase family protein [Paenibacillus lignilyticus]|uniref:Diacylglycerol kinase family protein n=1 Tax=Paenibacillus lignilyticus TaxID=1172615 RepID=A0ABS5CDX1_9BACL|nr:diacylglycerol kinase family protein [Paenibacillus lignilyticus]MBP3964192.1 diacylglycerol kinase family protein [Paenibacillus lignilyticus]
MNRLLRSFYYAGSGILSAVRTQANMKIHVVCAIVVNAAGLVVGLTRMEWAVIIAAQAVVMAAELMNTAVEHVVDLASPSRHPLAKAAKDTAAGGVLVAAIGAVIIGLFVFIPHLWP